jgi:predicted deacylase
MVARASSWVRAPQSGILRASVGLGTHVHKGDTLGVISDPFGENEYIVTAPYTGVTIGRLNLPLVNEGDALFHIARFDRPRTAASTVEEFQIVHNDLGPEPPVI